MVTHIFCIVTVLTIFSSLTNVNEAAIIPSDSRLLMPFRKPLTDAIAEKYVRTKRQLNIIQSKIVDIVHPKPIVDTLREEDKYGNTVEHTFGKNIVKAVENLSNVINTVFAFPIDTVKKVSRTATEALNNIGGKLVGLQK